MNSPANTLRTAVLSRARPRTAVKIYALAFMVCALYWPSTRSLFELWFSAANDTYQYGALVAVICGWMLWRRRAAFDAQPVEPHLLAALCLTSVAFAWLISYLAGIQTGHQVVLPAILWLAVLACFGWRVALIAAFPIAYLYLAIPMWGVIIGPLRWMTTHAVTIMLWISGISAQLQHPLIIIPEGAFEVASSCAGLNFILIAAAVSALYGELQDASRPRRALLCAVAVLVGLGANWVRVYLIVIAGHLTHMQHYLVVKSHYGFGWALFAVLMCAYLYFVQPKARSEGVPLQQPIDARQSFNRTERFTPYVAGIALLAAPAFLLAREFHDAPSVAISLPTLMEGGWAQASADADWKPKYAGADAQSSAAYTRGAERIEMYRAVYAEQYQDKELVNEENDAIGMSTREVELTGLASSAFDETRVRDAQGGEWLYWRAYRIGKRAVRSGLLEQLTYAMAAMRGPIASRVTVLRARCDTDCHAARRRLTEFAAGSGARADIP